MNCMRYLTDVGQIWYVAKGSTHNVR